MRKTIPKEKFKAMVYETKGLYNSNGYKFLGAGKVVGEFICGGYDILPPYKDKSVLGNSINAILKMACVTAEELEKYANNKQIYLLHLDAIRYFAYDPVPLSHYGLKRPPQSWQYLKGADNEQNKRVNRQVNISERHY